MSTRRSKIEKPAAGLRDRYRVVHRDGSISLSPSTAGHLRAAGDLLHLDGAVFDVTVAPASIRPGSVDKLSRQGGCTLKQPARSAMNCAIPGGDPQLMALIAGWRGQGLGVERAVDRVSAISGAAGSSATCWILPARSQPNGDGHRWLARGNAG
jgi:hypothetical protein